MAALSVLPIRLGGVPVGSYGLDPLEGGEFTTVLEGRAPTGADEVLVGSETLDRLDVDVGDSVKAAGLEGGGRASSGSSDAGCSPSSSTPRSPTPTRAPTTTSP